MLVKPVARGPSGGCEGETMDEAVRQMFEDALANIDIKGSLKKIAENLAFHEIYGDAFPRLRFDEQKKEWDHLETWEPRTLIEGS